MSCVETYDPSLTGGTYAPVLLHEAEVIEVTVPQAAAASRLEWIDIARGVAIILVMLAHTEYADSLRYILQPCRMPLFYITTGFLFNYERHRDSLFQYLGWRSRRLLAPYLITALFFCIVSMIGSQINFHAQVVSPARLLTAILYGNSATSSAEWNDFTLRYDVPLWFLTCLTSASVIFIALLYAFRNERGRHNLIIASLVTAVSGYLIGQRLFLPWNFDLAMMAQFFMVIGFLLRENKVNFSDRRILLLLVLAYTGLCISGKFGAMDMNRRIFADLGQFFIAGLAGTYVVYYLSHKLLDGAESSAVARGLVKTLQFFGRHTMVIMAFHFGATHVISLLTHYFPANPFIATSQGFLFIMMFLTSLLAIAVVSSIKPLRAIYYKS